MDPDCISLKATLEAESYECSKPDEAENPSASIDAV